MKQPILTQPTQRTSRILVIQTADTPEQALKPMLRQRHREITLAASADDAVRKLQKQEYHLLIAPAQEYLDGAAALSELAEHRRATLAVLLITPDDQPPDLKPVSRRAGLDWLSQSESAERFTGVADRLLTLVDLEHRYIELRQQAAQAYGFDNIVGDSTAMRRLRRQAARLAATDLNLVIQGPAGCGREVVARTVHLHSERAARPLMAIDFSLAPPESPVQILEQAAGGTILLDKLEQAPDEVLECLASILMNRVWEDESGNSRSLEARIVVVSETDPEQAAGPDHPLGRFINALSAVTLTIPPLGERREDIELLIADSLRRLAAEQERSGFEVSPGAIARLLEHDWPGDARELENCLRRAVALRPEGELRAEDIRIIGADAAGGRTNAVSQRSGRLDDSQRQAILRALRDNDWNYTKTARDLGIGRTTLWRKVKKYRLSKETAEIAD